MAIATTEQYAAMLDGASAGGYALPRVQVSSSETLDAALHGFAEAGSCGITQVSTGGGEFVLDGTVKDTVAGARALAAFACVLSEPCPGLVAPPIDRCPPDSGMGQKKSQDPRSWGRVAEAAMATRVTAAYERRGSAGGSVPR